jgi:hypothetical protein
MNSVARVRSVQGRLAMVAAVRAVAWAAAVSLGVLTIAMGLAALAPLPVWLRAAMPWVALLGGLSTLANIGWRERFVWSFPRVALWIEERAPALRYALVTAVDPRFTITLGPSLEPAIAQVDMAGFVRQAARRSIGPAIAALAVTTFAFSAAPRSWKAGIGGQAFTGKGGTPAAPASRLSPLVGTLTPPAYAIPAGLKEQQLREPTTIAGLAGSRVELSGPGSPNGIQARVGDSAAAVVAGKGGWTTSFTLPDSAAALQLSDRAFRRLIVLAPRRDEVPTVRLVAPAHDTTVRTPTGSLTLDANLYDDIGLASARFEYIISSGESEGNFTFRQGTVGGRTLNNATEGQLRLTLPLDYFKLQPGDQLSIRAAATDINTLSGPGIGYSESRMLRVARPGEYDSLAVEGAPPPADTALMTLRYLIQLTQELQQQRNKIPRPKFVSRSQSLGDQVSRLRARVEELQSERTLDGALPPNPLLNTAYLALAEGGGALLVAEPGEALPHLWAALKALQKFAWTERYYLRGKQPEVLVDLARVRLAGTDTGHATPRSSRGAADSVHAELRDAYADAMRLLPTARDSVVDRLLALQVVALRSEPAVASALGAAVAALRAGADAMGPLHEARRLLDGRPGVADSLPRWSGAW